MSRGVRRMLYTTCSNTVNIYFIGRGVTNADMKQTFVVQFDQQSRDS